MQVIGTQPDGPKNLPYMFDTVLELTKDGEKRMAIAHKDRTNSLPHEFEFTYQAFTDALGIEGLERKRHQNRWYYSKHSRPIVKSS